VSHFLTFRQRMKHHPYFAKLLSGDSTRIAYGARTLNEGGLQSIPKLHFPGGALIGCSAGFVNVAKIKGTHNAMKTGMLAAETAFDVLSADGVRPADMSAYEKAFESSWVYSDLYEVRNLRPSFNTPLGIFGGIVYSGIDSLLLKGRTPWTFHNPRVTDAAHTRRASQCTPIEYPPPQPPLSTDLLTALALTGTNHAEDQPAHLRVRMEEDGMVESSERRGEHVRVNVQEYAGLLGRACPAGVYEYVDDEDGSSGKEGSGGKKLVINAQVISSPSHGIELGANCRCLELHPL
jgi:electron-transferring-flavoprotein dehydrogenase